MRSPAVARLDLADVGSIAAFVNAWDGPLHLLLNNAGVVTAGLERTTTGRELQFATNHLGHHALASGLHRALAAGATERGEARVVALTSTAHMRAGLDFDDLDFDRRPYDPQIAYAQSKTANSLFAVEATRKWADDGITANAVNHGGIATGRQRNFSEQQKAGLDSERLNPQDAAHRPVVPCTSMVQPDSRHCSPLDGHSMHPVTRQR